MNLFIATDDFTVVKYVKSKVTKRKIFTFAEADRKGWVEKEFRSSTKAKIYADMISLFVDVETMIESEHFIGTFSSCVGQFVNVKRQCQKSSSIDYNFYFD